MVTLYVDDFEQVTMLEAALVNADINYNIELFNRQYGVRPPFIVVDGVPLDTNRAMKWIRRHSNDN